MKLPTNIAVLNNINSLLAEFEALGYLVGIEERADGTFDTFVRLRNGMFRRATAIHPSLEQALMNLMQRTQPPRSSLDDLL